MNLVIDIGNSRIKMASFIGHEFVNEIAATHSDSKKIKSFLNSTPDISACIISAVTGIPRWLTGELKKRDIIPLVLNSSTKLPFINEYKTKESLGNDRMADAAGACHLYPGRNVLIIDAGTAITFDIKTAKEEFMGGNISPGLSMRFKALHTFSSHLPLLQSESTEGFLGRTTNEAIQKGVQNGIIFEMEGYIQRLSNNYSDLIVLLTGGDAHFFENLLKKTIFVVSNLTLIGLNIILQHNAENQ
jgi:type III pantothenate kinase